MGAAGGAAEALGHQSYKKPAQRWEAGTDNAGAQLADGPTGGVDI